MAEITHLQAQLQQAQQTQSSGPTIDQAIQQLADTLAATMTRPPAPNLDTFIGRQGAGPLPSFDGTPAEWPVFIQIYESSTNTCNYTDAENLARLQNSLKGNAKTLVQSLLALPANVPTIIETLKLHYGRSDLIIETLIDQVQALPSVDELHLSDFAVAVQNLFTTIVSADAEAHLQNPQLRKDLVGRLPPSLRLQWGEKVAEVGPNHVNLSHFSKWLTAKANALSFVVQPQPKQTPALATATALVAVAPPRKPTLRPQPTRPLTCVYCDKPGHYPDECKRYATLADRKEQLNKKRRCYLCLSRRHTQAECDSARKCAHCQRTGRHHRSLCPTKFGQTGTPTTQKPSVTHHAEAAAQPSTCTERPTHTEPATLTVGWEVVHMQTVIAQVVNPRHPDSTVTAHILFDSGSYRTYITQTLADKLQLRQSNPDMLHLATFGNDAVQHISARSADLAVHLADDTTQQVTATVIPTITGNITTAPLSSKLRASLPADIQLADDDTTTQPQAIDILVGNDYFQDFILPERRQLRPGLYAVRTRLGWIVSGRTSAQPDTSSPTTTPSLVVMSALPAAQTNTSPLDKPQPERFWDLETVGIT